MAVPFSLRFLLAHRKTMCRELSVPQAFGLMRQGIREGKGLTAPAEKDPE